MRKNTTRTIFGLGVTGALVLAATASSATPLTAPVSDACAVTVTGTVPVQSEPVEVSAALSDTLPGAISASFAPESKITVDTLWHDGSAKAVRLKVNTASAVTGKWALTIKNANASCSGEVNVGSGSKDG